MPTGYTAGVVDGTIADFPTFALQCARAFGALILMRDDPMGAAIPDAFQPSDYHTTAADAARRELDAVLALTYAEVCQRARDEYDGAMARWREYEERTELERARIVAMMAETKAWEPPTPDHCEMKTFMLQQLTETLKWDGRVFGDAPALALPTGDQWRAEKIARLERDIAYHTEHHAEEVKRVEGRNRWVAALRESLTPESAVKP